MESAIQQTTEQEHFAPAGLQPSDGAFPPTVSRRWMLAVLARIPAPSVDFAARRSHGIAPGSGPGSWAFTSPTTLLPSLACHVGPAKCVPDGWPVASKSSASGPLGAHSNCAARVARELGRGATGRVSLARDTRRT